MEKDRIMSAMSAFDAIACIAGDTRAQRTNHTDVRGLLGHFADYHPATEELRVLWSKSTSPRRKIAFLSKLDEECGNLLPSLHQEGIIISAQVVIHNSAVTFQ